MFLDFRVEVVERSRRTPDFGWPTLVEESWSRGYGETVLHYGACGAADPDPATEPEEPL